MDYRQAVAYLESLEPQRIRPGLDRIRSLLDRLGRPHRDVPAVVIGGTNGKGSVTAYLASILREADVRGGAYISPHLVRLEERISIGGDTISEDEVAALTSEIRVAIDMAARDGIDRPTYFEATTALAFLHFSRRRVPLAILEVGMGGRFDATNVVEPLACAITPVEMDHMEWLGRSLREIAYQKAGILRPGIPVVIGRQKPEVWEVIRAEATRIGAPQMPTWACEARPAGGRDRLADPPVITLRTPSGLYEELPIALRGDHQADNATVAVLLAEDLANGLFRSIDRQAIARGIERTAWPGRIEIVPGVPELLLDGAHNPAACETLASYLREHQPGRRVALVFAAMKDKPVDAMLQILCPLAEEVVVTGLPVARGEHPAELLALAARRHGHVVRVDRVDEALEIGRRAAGAEGLCVVSGSLYLVGEIKRLGF